MNSEIQNKINKKITIIPFPYINGTIIALQEMDESSLSHST
jgi:hypothetical protein